MTRISSSILLLFLALHVHGFHIELKGVVTEHFSGDPLKKVKVYVYEDGEQKFFQLTKSSGKFSFMIDRESNYTVEFTREHFVTKRVTIDTHGIPAIPDVPFFEMFVQMALFPELEGVDYELFEKPLGHAVYRSTIKNMAWDGEYDKKMTPLVKRFLHDYERAFWRKERGLEPVPSRETQRTPKAPDTWPPVLEQQPLPEQEQ